jgi:1-acyl-sn-glycerol-3-phosphate acyltransferase
LAYRVLPRDIQQKIDQCLPELNSCGYDRWGLDPHTVKICAGFFWPLYKKYFRVRLFENEPLPANNVMLVANHSGQVPIDAILIGLAILEQGSNPRLLRSMVEYFVPTLPFISSVMSRCGQMVGEPHNCVDLLKHQQALLVFPEGVRGIEKPYREAYRLKKFGTGFCRLAHQTHSPIVPVAVIGAEEIYPTLFQCRPVAKLLKLPSLPITFTFPWLGVLGAIPFPSPVDIYTGKSVHIRSRSELSEEKTALHVHNIQKTMQKMIDQGLKKRSGFMNFRRDL